MSSGTVRSVPRSGWLWSRPVRCQHPVPLSVLAGRRDNAKAPTPQPGWHHISMQSSFRCWRQGPEAGSGAVPGELLQALGRPNDSREVSPNADIFRRGDRGSLKTETRTEAWWCAAVILKQTGDQKFKVSLCCIASSRTV